MKKLIIWLAILLPLWAQAQIYDTGTLQRNRTDSTVRGNFGSRGTMLIPTVSVNGTNGYILIFDSATNKYVPTDPSVLVPTLSVSTVSPGGYSNGLNYNNGEFRLGKVSATNPGVLTTGTDTISGLKKFTNRMHVEGTGTDYSLQVGKDLRANNNGLLIISGNYTDTITSALKINEATNGYPAFEVLSNGNATTYGIATSAITETDSIVLRNPWSDPTKRINLGHGNITGTRDIRFQDKSYTLADSAVVADLAASVSDSLASKANRTFDNVASGAIAKAKVDTSATGLQTVSNLFPKGDTRWLRLSTAASTYQTLANLSTDLTASATKYPSVNAVNTGLATKVGASFLSANQIPKMTGSNSMANGRLYDSSSGLFVNITGDETGAVNGYGFYSQGSGGLTSYTSASVERTSFTIKNSVTSGPGSGNTIAEIGSTGTNFILKTNGTTAITIANNQNATFSGNIYAPNLTTGTVTSVAAGNGLNFTTITGSGPVTLGTPSSITSSSTNSVTTNSHTHAITSLPSATTATTQTAGDNSTKIATTAYVDGAIVAKTNRILKDWYANANNVSTTETDLYDYTVPANTLVNNGDKLSFNISGIYGNTTNAKALKFYFGTYSASFGNTTTANGSWNMTGTIIKTGATTYRVNVFVKTNTSTTSTTFTSSAGTVTNYTGTNIFKIAGTGEASADITAQMGYLEFKPAAL